MLETITLDIKLRAFVRKDGRSNWIATCPAIGVASQGVSATAAKASLKEAVELWFESCVERGVLDQAMREANFRPAAGDDHVPTNGERVFVNREQNGNDEDDVLGDAFSVNLAVPAYQAAAFLNAGA